MSDSRENKGLEPTVKVLEKDALSKSLDDSIKLITNFARLKKKSKVGKLSVGRKEDIGDNVDIEVKDVNSQSSMLLAEERESTESDVDFGVKEADFEEFEKILKELKPAVLQDYLYKTQGEKKKICNFVNQFNATIKIITQSKAQLNYTESKAALDTTLIAAEQCKSIWEKVEAGVSPIAYVLGGLFGFLIGIPLGAIAGFLGGLYCLLKSNAPLPNPVVLKILFIGAMSICAVCGAIWGAIEGSKRFHSYSQRFFKPRATVNDVMSKFLRCNSFINEVLEKRAIAEATGLPTVLVGLIASYGPKSESSSELSLGIRATAR